MGPIESKIKGWQLEMRAVEVNPNLSDAGKEKQLAALQKQLTDYAPVAVSTVKRQANEIRKEFHAINDDAWPRAVEKAARQWDFPRLSYERERMQARLSALQLDQGDQLQLIEKAYNQVMSGGDVYSQLVWSELAASPILAQFGMRAGALIKRMERNAEDLRTTNEMRTLQEQSGKLALKASELQRDVNFAMKTFDYSTQLALQQVMSGIEVSERIDPATFALQTSLAVSDATPTAEGAPVGAPAAA